MVRWIGRASLTMALMLVLAQPAGAAEPGRYFYYSCWDSYGSDDGPYLELCMAAWDSDNRPDDARGVVVEYQSGPCDSPPEELIYYLLHYTGATMKPDMIAQYNYVEYQFGVTEFYFVAVPEPQPLTLTLNPMALVFEGQETRLWACPRPR